MHPEKRYLLPPVADGQGEDDAHGAANLSAPVVEPPQNKVYGKDLVLSDLLVLGTGSAFEAIFRSEYGIADLPINLASPETFSTTSQKAIVEVGGQKFFFKLKPDYSANPKALALSAAFQTFLAENTSFIPPIIDTQRGEKYLQVGGRTFFLTPFREGRIFNGSLKDIQAAGTALGEIHALANEFKFPDLNKKYSYNDAQMFIGLAERLQGSGDDAWKARTISALQDIIDSFKENRDLPYVMNHGDFAPFNLVFNNGQVAAVNDFDNVELYPRVRDLGGAIITFCDGIYYAGATSSLKRPIVRTFNLEKAKAMVASYLEKAPPLSEVEQKYLIGEICTRWVKIMSLGIVRGDFGYRDVFEALEFPQFVNENIPKMFTNS